MAHEEHPTDQDLAEQDGVYLAHRLNELPRAVQAQANEPAAAEPYHYLDADALDTIREEGVGSYLNQEVLEAVCTVAFTGADPTCFLEEKVFLLFSTGGPATRAVADLGREKAWVEAQTWFTPWTRVSEHLTDEAQQLLLEEAQGILDSAREMQQGPRGRRAP